MEMESQFGHDELIEAHTLQVYPTTDRSAPVDILIQAVDGEDFEEVTEGTECTLRVSGFTLQRGDVIETYRVEQLPSIF
jgi:hypothetical protein